MLWRLLKGDCVEQIATLEPKSIDSVVTSPPYAEQRKKLYGGIPESEYPAFTVAWMEALKPKLKDKGSVLINIREHIKNGQMSDYVLRTRLALREAGWNECDELIWIKPDAPPLGHPGRPRRSWERILWFSLDNQPWCDPKANGTPSKFIGVQHSRNSKEMGLINGVAEYKEGIARCKDYVEIGVSTNSKGVSHPAMYPLGFSEWMIKLVTPVGGTVLDPFVGSGTTMLAAVQNGFNAVGCELNPEYWPIIENRMEGL